MQTEKEDTVRQAAWPRTQWHPVYESVQDWLDGEAPVSDVRTRSRRNQPTRTRYTRSVVE